MEEHRFPFDLDADLRREVKLEVESEIVRGRIEEVRRRLFSLVGWFVTSLALGIGAYVLYFRLSRPVAGLIVLAFATLVSLLGNFPSAIKLFLAWRAVVNAKRESQSWDGVADDYRQAIRRKSDS